MLREEAQHEPGFYDVVHSHYWLSGQVGWLARDRWSVPLIHTAHTLAKVKNAALADGDRPEPRARVIGEEQVVAEADRLIANTEEEAGQLVRHYGADPPRTLVVPPGVDLDRFAPGRPRGGPPRRRRARTTRCCCCSSAGSSRSRRPTCCCTPPREMLADDPALRGRLRVHVVGAPSGSGPRRAATSWRSSPRALGIADVVRFLPPQPPERLAEHYRAADVAVVPSHNESFGLVALEAQACGTPVVAAAVGGLRTAVRDGVSGVLVDGHDPADYAAAVRDGARPPRAAAAGARRHAAQFSWDRTADSPGRGLRLGGRGAGRSRAGRAREPVLGSAAGAAAARRWPGEREPASVVARLDAVIEQALRDSELEHEHPAPGRWLVDLPGTKKLKTVCGLIVGEHALRVEAFVCRQPDENREQLWTFLLQHNARMYGVALLRSTASATST